MSLTTCANIGVGPDCPADGSPLGYAPNLAASIAFLSLFAVSLIAHVVWGIRYRTWTFMACMVLGSMTEVIGYVGRVFMYKNPYNLSTIMIFGRDFSRIAPIRYSQFFIFCDWVSLSLQGAGGGLASSSATDSTMNLGNRLMLAGLITQVVTMFIFGCMCADLAIRIRRYPERRNPKYKLIRSSVPFRGFLIMALVFGLSIFIRCVYRVTELGPGWDNPLMRNETLFIILESCMITIASIAFCIFHPGFGFQRIFDKIEYSTVPRETSWSETNNEICWRNSSYRLDGAIVMAKASQKLVWLVSGCSSGIGAALSAQILESGHCVVATARNLATLSDLPDTPSILTLQLDITSRLSIEAAFAKAITRFGHVDIVVNNAGYGILGDAEGITEEEARAIFETNYWGTVNMSLEAMKTFRQVNPVGQGGLIIQISSFLGRFGFAGNSSYSASKFAIEGWTECASLEVHPDWNIKYLILELGGVKTEFAGSNYIYAATHPDYVDPSCPTNQLKKFLASPEARAHWATAPSVAKRIIDIVRSTDLPLRLAVGEDAWKLIKESVCSQDISGCKQCLRAGYVCPKYRDHLDLNFRNETAAVVQKAQSRKTSEIQLRGLGAGSSDPFNSLSVPLHDQEMKLLMRYTMTNLEPALAPLGRYSAMKDVWLPMIISDPLVLYGAMASSAGQLAAQRRQSACPLVLKYSQMSISHLNERLRDQDPSRAISNTTMAAVLGLLTQAVFDKDYETARIHMTGMRRMISLGGGLDATWLNPVVRDTIFWADFCCACSFGSRLQFTLLRSQAVLNTLPLNIYPGTEMALMGQGFADLLHTSIIFDEFIRRICELRFLIVSLRLAQSNGKLNLMPSQFKEKCLAIEGELSAPDRSARRIPCNVNDLDYLRSKPPRGSRGNGSHSFMEHAIQAAPLGSVHGFHSNDGRTLIPLVHGPLHAHSCLAPTAKSRPV
ncbi:hypothetical protein V501_04380 [Pseudogymnoascus sp. VKM F-4519 (FW-2642)]|nr:hypothetical protein V501_04380 [Pseudogymnoascus sp. VKM F-4519 (FW-2642)]